MKAAGMRIVVLLLPLGLTGCYGAQLIRQPVAVDKTEQRVQTLAEQQTRLNAQMTAIEEAIARQEEMIRALRADTQTRMQELADGLESLGARMEENLERPSRYAPPPVWEAPRQAPPSGAGDTTQSPTGEMSSAQTKAIYDNAYLDLTRGNYSLALLGFEEFLRKSPDSELADNAQYWIGECYYVQRDFPRAIEEFSRVGTDYPQGDKVAAAMLKVGFSHLEMEDRAAARRELRDLVERFPNSDEAKRARAKLKSLE